MTKYKKILEAYLPDDESYKVFDGYTFIDKLYIHDVEKIEKFVDIVKHIQIKHLGFGHLSENQSKSLESLDKSLESFYVGGPDVFGASYEFMIEKVLYPQYVESFYDKDGNPVGEEFDPDWDDEHFQGYQDTCDISDLSFLSSFDNLKEISINTMIYNVREVNVSSLSKLKKLKKIFINGKNCMEFIKIN